MMTFSVESYSPPSSEFASNLLFNIDALLDVYFAKKRSYMKSDAVQVTFFAKQR